MEVKHLVMGLLLVISVIMSPTVDGAQPKNTFWPSFTWMMMKVVHGLIQWDDPKLDSYRCTGQVHNTFMKHGPLSLTCKPRVELGTICCVFFSQKV